MAYYQNDHAYYRDYPNMASDVSSINKGVNYVPPTVRMLQDSPDAFLVNEKIANLMSMQDNSQPAIAPGLMYHSNVHSSGPMAPLPSANVTCCGHVEKVHLLEHRVQLLQQEIQRVTAKLMKYEAEGIHNSNLPDDDKDLIYKSVFCHDLTIQEVGNMARDDPTVFATCCSQASMGKEKIKWLGEACKTYTQIHPYHPEKERLFKNLWNDSVKFKGGASFTEFLRLCNIQKSRN